MPRTCLGLCSVPVAARCLAKLGCLQNYDVVDSSGTPSRRHLECALGHDVENYPSFSTTPPNFCSTKTISRSKRHGGFSTLQHPHQSARASPLIRLTWPLCRCLPYSQKPHQDSVAVLVVALDPAVLTRASELPNTT